MTRVGRRAAGGRAEKLAGVGERGEEGEEDWKDRPCTQREVRRGPVATPALRGVTYFHEVMDGLEIGQIVVVDVHADAEVEASVASVDDLEVPELWAERSQD